MKYSSDLIAAALSNPLSRTSHFLTCAPMIALGYNYEIDSSSKDGETYIKDLYVLLHEYVHYECYTYWPSLVITYFINAIEAMNTIYSFAHPACKSLFLSGMHSFLTQVVGTIPEKAIIRQRGTNDVDIIEMGTDILLEGTALLNYRCKPRNKLYQFSEEVIQYLLSSKNKSNFIHFISVNLSIQLVECLEDIIGKRKSNLTKDLLYKMPATINFVLSLYAFGYSMVMNGFNIKKLDWQNAMAFVRTMGIELWHTYIGTVKRLFNDIYLKHEFGQFVLVNDPKYRDVSIVGYHCFLTLIYSEAYRQCMAIKSNDKLFFSFFGPIQTLLKLNEAMNIQTLRKYSAPKIWPSWIPVPIISIYRRHLGSVRFSKSRRSTGSFTLAFGVENSIRGYEHALYGYVWTRMLFLTDISESIKDKGGRLYCPLRRWVRSQYEAIGITDEDSIDRFLVEFCNNGLNVNYDLIPEEHTILPSETYCSFSITEPFKIRSGEAICYFHNVAKYCLGVETVA